MTVRSGRNGGGGGWTYRKNLAKLRAAGSRCGICGHGGAITGDHIISKKLWPVGRPGFDDLINLQLAHGTMSGPQPDNWCVECVPPRLCNQSKGGRVPPPRRPQSRDW